MMNLSSEYLKKHINIIENTWRDSALKQSDEFLNARNNLFIVNVDIKDSTALPVTVSSPVVDLIRLMVATEIQARGGIVFRFTDGVDSFFTDGANAFRSALSIYFRKKEMQDKVFPSLLKNLFQNKEPEIKASDIDYRVLLCYYPYDLKNEILRSANSERIQLESLADKWKEAISRVNQDFSFLVSKKACQRMLPAHQGMKDYVNTSRLIKFKGTQSCPI